MDEPAIITYGRQFRQTYKVQEYREVFVRAFRDGGADFIVLDDNRYGQKFLSAAAAWAIDEGLIYNDRNDDDGQRIVSSFRLTEKGQKEILGRS